MTFSVSAASSRRGLFFATALVLILLAGGIAWHVRAAGAASMGPSDAADATGNSGEDILLGLAKTAVSERRLVAPAGSNAYEFYLSALQLDPQNAHTRESLAAAFSDACNDVERTINARDVDEAQRELSLLRDYDSNNYKLALLGSKLSAQRVVMTREHEAQAAAIQARAENARR